MTALSRRGLCLVARFQAPAVRLPGPTLVFRLEHRNRRAAYRPQPIPAMILNSRPDGKQLAYVRKHNLYVHPVAGELGEYQLTRDETKGQKDKRQE